jgi:hypothetical protein
MGAVEAAESEEIEMWLFSSPDTEEATCTVSTEGKFTLISSGIDKCRVACTPAQVMVIASSRGRENLVEVGAQDNLPSGFRLLGPEGIGLGDWVSYAS